MEEPKKVILSVQLRREKKVIDSIERNLYLFETEDSPRDEVTGTKTLDDVINDFIGSIEEACKEKSVSITDRAELFVEMALRLVLFQAEDEKIVVKVPVKEVPQKAEREREDEPPREDT